MALALKQSARTAKVTGLDGDPGILELARRKATAAGVEIAWVEGRAVRLSRAVMRNIRQNLFWAFAYNFAGLPLAAGLLYPFTGWLLNPMFAGAAMSLSSISVVANALRLRRLRL